MGDEITSDSPKTGHFIGNVQQDAHLPQGGASGVRKVPWGPEEGGGADIILQASL